MLAIGETLRFNSDLRFTYILKDNKQINQFAKVFAKLFPSIHFVKIPSWDCAPYDFSSPDSRITGERINAIINLSSTYNLPRLVLLCINSLTQKTILSHYFSNTIFRLSNGSLIEWDNFTLMLTNSGYRRSETVMEVGEYAIRGSIIDIFSSNYDYPMRIDLFDNKISSIKMFDPLTQITFKKVDSIILLPISELIYSSKAINNFKNQYREKFGINSVKDNIYQSVIENTRYPGVEHWMPLFYSKLGNIFEIIDKSYTFVFNENFEELCKIRIEEIREAYNSRYITYKNIKKNKSSSDYYKPLELETMYLDEKKIDNYLKERRVIHFSKIATSSDCIDIGGRLTVGMFQNKDFIHKGIFNNLINFIDQCKKQNIKFIIACRSEGSRKRITKYFDKEGFNNYEINNSWDEKFCNDTQRISLMQYDIDEGFRTNKLIVITEKDIFGKKLSSFRKKIKKTNINLSEIENFHIGDHLIHSEYGLGKYVGLKTIKIHGLKNDCLALSYLEGDKVFVPVQNINLLTRYGGDTSSGLLDKLGAKSWINKKNKVKEKIKDLAESLIRIASKRHLKKAKKLEVIEEVYEKFAFKFDYYETEDQLDAIKDVINDIKLEKPMDRLICGDVGFGKTEVAMRAAFIAVRSKTQVALIAPTTVLARQHLETFKDRFKGEKIKISQLSRLTKFKNRLSIINGLSSGEIDIVIGTHSLLSSDIKFKNLSLFIIDEEQRFGVMQKEKIKSITNNVHVLTLTATPIPRTLQMAVFGIRELSIIATPPQERVPIRSFIIPYDSYIIREAINRELNRGGQVYCIVPRISDIKPFENKIRNIATKIRTTYKGKYKKQI